MSKRPPKPEQAQETSQLTADVSGLESVNPILRHVAEQINAKKAIDFSLHIKFSAGKPGLIQTGTGGQ